MRCLEERDASLLAWNQVEYECILLGRRLEILVVAQHQMTHGSDEITQRRFPFHGLTIAWMQIFSHCLRQAPALERHQ